jgi:hypothetical protein
MAQKTKDFCEFESAVLTLSDRAVIDIETGVVSHNAVSYVSLEGPEDVLDQHRENIVAIAKGPWKTDYFVRVAKTPDEKCNLDADGQPHCP